MILKHVTYVYPLRPQGEIMLQVLTITYLLTGVAFFTLTSVSQGYRLYQNYKRDKADRLRKQLEVQLENLTRQLKDACNETHDMTAMYWTEAHEQALDQYVSTVEVPGNVLASSDRDVAAYRAHVKERMGSIYHYYAENGPLLALHEQCEAVAKQLGMSVASTRAELDEMRSQLVQIGLDMDELDRNLQVT